jgi:hypothetical protein
MPGKYEQFRRPQLSAQERNYKMAVLRYGSVPSRPYLLPLPIFFLATIRLDFFGDDFLVATFPAIRFIDRAAFFSFVVAFPADLGILFAIDLAFAPAAPPTTAPTAAPIGPINDPAAAPAAAPPTIPTPDNEPDFSACAFDFAMNWLLNEFRSY